MVDEEVDAELRPLLNDADCAYQGDDPVDEAAESALLLACCRELIENVCADLAAMSVSTLSCAKIWA